MESTREDFREILRLVRPGARVLDVGCEDGELLELLKVEKGVDGQGLEISPAGVAACLAKGLAVVQGDGDRDLDHFPTRAFDYAILSKTLQQMREPRHVLSELLRIAAPDSLTRGYDGAGGIEWMARRCIPGTIYAGTSEVQRSLIAEAGLGLPRTRNK